MSMEKVQDKNPPSSKEEPPESSKEKEEDYFDYAESSGLEAIKKANEELRRNPRKK